MTRRLVMTALLACVVATAAAQVIDQHLLQPDPQDWLMYSGTYNAQRHSLLKQVTPGNVANLQARWVYHMAGQETIQAVPIVYSGVMYISQFNRVDAIDARSGNIVWQYQRPPLTRSPQRGTAIYNHKLFVTAADGALVAVDSRTGHTVWETKVAPPWRLAGQAPLVAKGHVIVSGNQPSGFIQAYDAESGRHVWTWNAIPQKAGDPGSETWAGDSFKVGGGPVWVSGSYDPQQNLIFYGTGQPGSQWAGEVREGDNLYTDSIVAIDVDTGKTRWHFQNTPHDVHDWDSLEMPVLLDATFNGQPRKLLLQANRNGVYYILDRTNGRFLRGVPFVSKVDWMTSLSPEGRPILAPGHTPTVQGTKTCPSTAGATNWPSPAYNPDTKLFYLIAQEGCGITYRSTTNFRPGQGGSGTAYMESPDDRERWQLYVRAIDALTGKKVWDFEQVSSFHYGPGLLSTAGGLIFAPEQQGMFTALDAKTGKALWNFNTGGLITAAPTTYSIDGQQYVAISAFSNVIAFALPEAP
jgi:alcohol dehydrogenase (cytochrome c)